jgi:hypothetical protein
MDYGICARWSERVNAPGTNVVQGAKTAAVTARSTADKEWHTLTNSFIHDQSPMCFVGQVVTAASTRATWDTMYWGDRRFDPHAMASSSTTASDKVYPPWAGRYEVTVGDSWPTNALGSRGLRVYRGGGTAVLIAEVLRPATTDEDTSLTATGVIDINPDSTHYVYVARYQSSTGDLTPSSTSHRVFLSVRMIGGTT